MLGGKEVSALERLAVILADVAAAEDRALRSLCGQGIFFMPELAYAYACGKAIMAEVSSLFPDADPAWMRELNLGAGGPCDLVLKLGDERHIVVEFKMRDKLAAYVADIEKLARLDEKNARLFCVLLDSFTKDLPDARVSSIPDQSKVMLTPLMEPFPTFSTQQERYRGEISCVVAVWAVGNIPAWARAGRLQS